MVAMDHNNLREKEVFVDLESGANAIIDEQEVNGYNGSLHNDWGGFMNNDGLVRGEVAEIARHNSSSSIEVPVQNGEAMMDKRSSEGEAMVALLDKKAGRADRPRKKGFKKPPKPPRPPTSPPLDAADQKILREMSELAMLKRARIERMKALKKKKNAKAVSNNSNSNLCAMVITVLFCLVILWQGLFSKNASSVNFQGSPESPVGSRGGFITVHFYKNTSSSGPHSSRSASPNIVEQVSGMEGRVETNRIVG